MKKGVVAMKSGPVVTARIVTVRLILRVAHWGVAFAAWKQPLHAENHLRVHS